MAGARAIRYVAAQAARLGGVVVSGSAAHAATPPRPVGGSGGTDGPQLWGQKGDGKDETTASTALAREAVVERKTEEMSGSGNGGSRGGTRQTQIDRCDRPCHVHPVVWPSWPARRSDTLRTRRAISSFLPPIHRPPSPLTPVSDCTVPCSYMVHPGYAYPSALLWVDLPFNKVGPCQNKRPSNVIP